MAKPANTRSAHVAVSLPDWMMKAIDDEAQRMGLSRQGVVKIMLNSVIKRPPVVPVASDEQPAGGTTVQ